MTPRDELQHIKLAQIQQKREAAARARRIADQFLSAADRDRALRFAEELDAQAEELQRRMAVEETDSQVTQTQVQVQQGPPAKREDEQK
jgi:hypothetical protein